jgi:hypothetical protein
VDVYVPGCPPTPQALLNGLITLQKKIDQQSIRTAPWYRSEGRTEIPSPVLGPDIFDPRRAQEIKAIAADPTRADARVQKIIERAALKHAKEGHLPYVPNPALAALKGEKIAAGETKAES